MNKFKSNNQHVFTIEKMLEIRDMIDKGIAKQIKIEEEIKSTKNYQNILFSKYGLQLLFGKYQVQ